MPKGDRQNDAEGAIGPVVYERGHMHGVVNDTSAAWVRNRIVIFLICACPRRKNIYNQTSAQTTDVRNAKSQPQCKAINTHVGSPRDQLAIAPKTDVQREEEKRKGHCPPILTILQ